MGFMDKVKEFINVKIEEKKELDEVYKEAYKEQSKQELIIKAKHDAKQRFNPDLNKKKEITPIFKQGLVDEQTNYGKFKIGSDE